MKIKQFRSSNFTYLADNGIIQMQIDKLRNYSLIISLIRAAMALHDNWSQSEILFGDLPEDGRTVIR